MLVLVRLEMQELRTRHLRGRNEAEDVAVENAVHVFLSDFENFDVMSFR